MLFNSLNFLLFLPVVFFSYWFLFQKDLKKQNILLLVASYFFYATWDYRFLFLLMFSTLLDYVVGITIEQAPNRKKKKFLLILSVVINLGFLGFFKYYDFFALSFAQALNGVGLHAHPATLNIILPVGISFYTFHGLSYVFDIYNEKIPAEKNFISYGLFVSFFPLLVAGPIERATHLLPQLKKKRPFDYTLALMGLRQILWGFFKKVVIADNCSIYVDAVFQDYRHAGSAQIILSIFLFAFQIYGDFSGYSDIALGVAKLFGIELLRNFNFPYFSRSIAEFWRRWHISLSSWFKDYLYIPLGGSKVSKLKQVPNTFIIFLVSGFWHGANWTFIFWGLLNAIYIMPSILFSTNRSHIEIVARGRAFPSLREFFNMALTFLLVCFAWIFFRSASIKDAFEFILTIKPHKGHIKELSPTYSLIGVAIMLCCEWYWREYAVPFSKIRSGTLRYISYLIIAILIFLMGAFINPRSFIYFQF